MGLLETLQQSGSTANLQALERKTGSSREVLLKLGAATEGWSSAHSELQDALKETLRSRSAVVEAQRSKLALLQQVAKNKEFAVTKQKVQVARAQATVDSLQKK